MLDLRKLSDYLNANDHVLIHNEFTWGDIGKLKHIRIKRIKITLKQYLKNDFCRRNKSTN